MSKAITIIGSGLSGLILGQSLKNWGFSVLLVDKGRKPGGRLLSKRVGGRVCDIGPGWFHTLEEITPDFLYSALAAVSAEPVAFENLPASVTSGLPRQSSLKNWKIPGGIRRLTEELTRPLDVLQSIQLKSIKKRESEWLLECVDAAHGDNPIEMISSNVVLTSPWPQALELLQKSELLNEESISLLADLPDYEKCLVAAFELGNDTAASLGNLCLEPTGDDVLKRLHLDKSESGHFTLVIHALPDFSDRRWSHPEESLLAELKQHAGHHLNLNLENAPAQFHRWKYATLKPEKHGPTQPLVISQSPTLILTGEVFGLVPQIQSGILAAQNSAKLASELIRQL